MKRRPKPYYSQHRTTASRNHLHFVLTYVDAASSHQPRSVRDLGVQLDSAMSMAAHVSRTCRTAYAHLRCISRIRSSLTVRARKTLVHALVTSKLDFGNAALCGINGSGRMPERGLTFDPGFKGMLHWRKYTTFTLLCINSIIYLEAICP